VVAGGVGGGMGDRLRSKVPRFIWTTGIVGSSRLRVRDSEETAAWASEVGALKGGFKDGIMDGVRNTIFEEG